jgi:hypothetical protein
MTSDVLPRPGDIGLVRVRGDVGRLIRVGQWLNGSGYANYEHAFVFVGAGTVVEAQPGGARPAALAEYDGRQIAWLRCPPQYGVYVAAAAHELVGTPYSFADYAALAAHRLHIPAPGLRSYIKASGHAICSQLADRAAYRGGWHLFADRRWEGDVTPADLYDLLPVWGDPA